MLEPTGMLASQGHLLLPLLAFRLNGCEEEKYRNSTEKRREALTLTDALEDEITEPRDKEGRSCRRFFTSDLCRLLLSAPMLLSYTHYPQELGTHSHRTQPLLLGPQRCWHVAMVTSSPLAAVVQPPPALGCDVRARVLKAALGSPRTEASLTPNPPAKRWYGCSRDRRVLEKELALLGTELCWAPTCGAQRCTAHRMGR